MGHDDMTEDIERWMGKGGGRHAGEEAGEDMGGHVTRIEHLTC